MLDAVAPLAELKVPNTTVIKRGDKVELACDLEYYGTRYPEGLRGTVMHVYTAEGNYPYKVKIDGTDVEINFNRPEIRKAA